MRFAVQLATWLLQLLFNAEQTPNLENTNSKESNLKYEHEMARLLETESVTQPRIIGKYLHHFFLFSKMGRCRR